jgi:hypothetical protein
VPPQHLGTQPIISTAHKLLNYAQLSIAATENWIRQKFSKKMRVNSDYSSQNQAAMIPGFTTFN